VKPNLEVDLVAAAGRQQQFTSLFNAHYDDVFAYARRRVPGDAEAEDVAAETFAIAWRRLDEIHPDVPLAWLYGIARRVLANGRRGETRRSRLIARLMGALRPTVGLASDEAHGEATPVLVALRRLSPSDQELLRLAAWEGLSHAEIGATLNCSSGAVAVRLHRARGRLARLLEAETVPGYISTTGRLALPAEEDG
jgi:RNA polymerase sigma-70 factor (ECF subfamily)